MSNVYVKDGDSFMPVNSEQLQVLKELPTGVYTVSITRRGYILKEVDKFEIPTKIYGDTEALASRILNTYDNRKFSTGVLLSGLKGSGKTLLAKYISTVALEKGMITLLVNTECYGEDFNIFIQSISQPALIIFDEFEKVYGAYEQEHLLTLFDGVYSQKKLFIVTCNNVSKINRHMINRPGRMYYSIEFKGISEQFVLEYCEDCLCDMNHVNDIVKVVKNSRNFSFDMLQTLIEEMNRYNENVDDALKLLNIINHEYDF